MKTLLLGLTVVTCIVVAESAPFDAPILKLIKELDELRMTANNFLEHQEQNPNTTATAITTDAAATASPSTAGFSNLTCAFCNETTEQLCFTNEIQNQCTADQDRCFTVSYFSTTTFTNTVAKGCIALASCGDICNRINDTFNSAIQTCNSQCCDTNLCNSGNPLPTATTPAPMTTQPTSTSLASTSGETTATAMTTEPPSSASPSTSRETTATVMTTEPPSSASPSTAGETTATAMTTEPPSSASPSTSGETTATAMTTEPPSSASPSTAGETTASPTTPVVCGGLLAGPSGEIRSPNAPNPYPNNVQCVWTIVVPSGQFIRITITITLADPGDSFRILQGNTTVFSTTGRRKRSLYDDPSYEHVYREDEGDYYDDGDNKDYYFYDGRRKKEQYFYHQRRKRAVFTLDIAGNGQPINMIFTSDASGSASGVIAQFSVQAIGGRGGSSSESGGGGGSSDEEE